jgi:hypothetical protein
MDRILGEIAAALQARNGPAAVRLVRELDTSQSDVLKQIIQGSDALSPAVFVGVMDGVLARCISPGDDRGVGAAVDKAKDKLIKEEVRSCNALRPQPERAAVARSRGSCVWAREGEQPRTVVAPKAWASRQLGRHPICCRSLS